MTCVHLRKLYQFCQTEEIKVSSADLVHFVCPQCGVQDVCPSVLLDEYEATHHESESPRDEAQEPSSTNSPS